MHVPIWRNFYSSPLLGYLRTCAKIWPECGWAIIGNFTFCHYREYLGSTCYYRVMFSHYSEQSMIYLFCATWRQRCIVKDRCLPWKVSVGRESQMCDIRGGYMSSEADIDHWRRLSTIRCKYVPRKTICLPWKMNIYRERWLYTVEGSYVPWKANLSAVDANMCHWRWLCAVKGEHEL